MNKREVISSVAARSGVSPAACEKVINAFEDVFNEELENSTWKGSLFDKVYKLITFLGEKRNKK
ncbi:MAG: HU family DNA-binding protein [Tannerellaceae bacterium]|nr:HU family DNA-binding protein [Tannerellaceae bacterium]MCD8265241.1 HU family DNA-binding protein [Tannerellaceae bacterium]